MSFRYSSLRRWWKILYRKVNPVPKSPWTTGKVEDICEVQLVPSETLETFFSKSITLLKSFREVPGDYLEFGVFNGASLSSMYVTAKRRKVPMNFFGFDAFQGLPPGSEKEDDGVWKEGFYACPFLQLRICLKRKNIDAKDITWVKGWYKDSLTPKVAKKLINIGIVFIDCDTHSSSKTVLDFLAPLIKQEVIICLDDWKLNDLDVKGLGEYKAFNEFLESNPQLRAEEIPSYNRKSKSFIVRPRQAF